MAKQVIGIGNAANDGSGDPLRTAGDKINDNFNEFYTKIGDGTNLYPLTFPNANATVLTTSNVDASSGEDVVVSETKSITSPAAGFLIFIE